MAKKALTRKERRLQEKRRQKKLKCLAAVAAVLVCAALLLTLGVVTNRVASDRADDIRNNAYQEAAAKIRAVTPVPAPVDPPTPTAEFTPEPTPTPLSYTVRITASGDCTIGGNVRSDGFAYFDSFVKENGYDYFFDNVRGIFEDDDLTIINFEGTIPDDDDTCINNGFNFKALKDYTQIMTGSSVEVCNLANNHSRDFGVSGMESTAANLEAAGLGVFGYEHTYETEINGVRVGICGFTEWRSDIEESAKLVEELCQRCDLVIANMHGGAEKSNTSNHAQRNLARALIDAGADIVIGNHSHVISTIEMYKGKYILYSLGNFCFGGNKNPDDKDCFLFQQEFHLNADGEIEDNGIKIIPCSISSVSNKNNFQPTPLTGSEYDRVLKKIKKYANVDASEMVFLDDTPYRTDLQESDDTTESKTTPAAEETAETAEIEG